MKINGRLIRTGALAFIIGATAMSILLWVIFPQLTGYTPEDPALLKEQKIAAGLTALFGSLCAILFAKR